MPLRTFVSRTFLYTGIFLFLSTRICFAEILLNNGQLTVQVDGIPLAAILDEISKQGHISINSKGVISEQRITIQFGPLPLENGLKRILRKTNYLTIYDQNENIIGLSIFGSMPTTPSSGIYTPLQAEPIFTTPAARSEVVSPNEPEGLENKEAAKETDRKIDEKRPDSPTQPAEVTPKEGP